MLRVNDMTKLAIGTLFGTLAAAAVGITALDEFGTSLGLTVSGVAMLAAVGVPLFFYYRKQWGDAYRGRIEFKGTEERATFDANGNFVPIRLPYLVVRLADGGQKRVYVGNRTWSAFQVGQAIVKRAGRLNLELERRLPIGLPPQPNAPSATQATAIPQPTGNKKP